MGISLSGFKILAGKMAAAKRIAAAQASALKKQRKRKGFSKFLGGIGGKIVGGIAAGLTGGLAAPLIAGLASWGTKRLVDEGTKAIGMGATAGDIAAIKEASGEYGFGKEQAAQAQDIVKAGRKDIGHGGKGLLGEVVGSVTGAVAGGKYLDKFKGKLGPIGDMVTKGQELYKKGQAELGFGEGAALPTMEKVAVKQLPEGFGEIATSAQPVALGDISAIGQSFEDPAFQSSVENAVEGFEVGGYVNQESLGQQMMQQAPPPLTKEQLLKFTKMQVPEKEENDVPTISDYFGKKGRSLGGNSKQSISQLLGR